MANFQGKGDTPSVGIFTEEKNRTKNQGKGHGHITTFSSKQYLHHLHILADRAQAVAIMVEICPLSQRKKLHCKLMKNTLGF
jgi:hypothetical protein